MGTVGCFCYFGAICLLTVLYYYYIMVNSGKGGVLMDIAMMSTVSSQIQLQQQVQLSVMNKVMDQSQENSDGLQKLLKSADISAMQQSVEPNLGASFDLKV